jgi:hypothetical protein
MGRQSEADRTFVRLEFLFSSRKGEIVSKKSSKRMRTNVQSPHLVTLPKDGKLVVMDGNRRFQVLQSLSNVRPVRTESERA